MGEYSFDYLPPVSKEREHGFQYKEVETDEYSFAYGRDIKSDTSKFNDLIPAIKSGVRSSYYGDLWLDITNEAGKYHSWQTVKAEHKDTEYQPGAGFNELYFNDVIENGPTWLKEKKDNEFFLKTGESLYRKFSTADLIDLLNLERRKIQMTEDSIIPLTQKKDLSYFVQINLQINKKLLEKNRNISISQQIKIANVDLLLALENKEKNTNINQIIDIKNKSSVKTTNIERIKSIIRSSLFHTNKFITKVIDRLDNDAFYMDDYQLEKRQRIGEYDYSDPMAETPEKHGLIKDSIEMKKRDSYGQKNTKESFGIKEILYSLKEKTQVFGKRSSRLGSKTEIRGVTRKKIFAFLSNKLKLFSKTVNQLMTSSHLQVSKPKEVQKSDTMIKLDTRDKIGFVFHKDYGFKITKKMMEQSLPGQQGTKETQDVWNGEDFEFGNKMNHIMKKKSTDTMTIKNDKNMVNLSTEVFGEKQNISIITDFDLFAQKKQIPMNTIRRMQEKGNVLIFLDKSKIDSDIVVWDYGVSKEKTEIWNVETNKSGYKDSKNTKPIDLKEELFGIKEGVMIDVFQITSLFHLPSDFFIDCQNQLLKKDGVNGKLDENKWIDKNGKKADLLLIKNLFVQKEKKRVNIEDCSTFLKKDGFSIFFDGEQFGEKIGHSVKLEENTQIGIDKQKKKAFDQNKMNWFETYAKDSNIENQTSGNKNGNEIVLANEEIEFEIEKGMIPFLSFFEIGTKQKEALSEDSIVIADRTIKESEIGKTIQALEKCLKDTDYEDREQIRWAWVYETKDPFDNYKIGIDELLIPENDIRYKDFENVLFDKIQMRPKSPIKKIDETTWVVRYPIKHPLPEYSELGLEYLDIDTGLMKRMFLEFYRVWQKNIFRFGGMDMVQATSVMLDYMYSWITLYVPDDLKLQGYRILKMIRWFAESAIIKNSQYILSYELEDLKSNLHTGVCEIPNEMNNMQIFKEDSVFGTIESNKEAYVEFYVRNAKETTITLSIITTVGTVFIYVNDELVDKVTTTSRDLIYKLPYADPINTVKVIKPKEHNKNKDFYIGYISISDAKPGDLTIKYDPVLKAGNKPMDEISKKMIELANLYENNKEILEQLQKGNLGVSETYKLLKNYWDIHHNNKEKGKRLTIKQV